MGKVTYLIGAGASANCIPPIDGIPKCFAPFRQFIKDLDNSTKHRNFDKKDAKWQEQFANISDSIIGRKTWAVHRQHMLDDIEQIEKAVSEQASIDTYAKKLFIQGGPDSKDYIKLKCILSLVLIHRQQTEPLDYRYDSFFASTLSPLAVLPNNIRIISWNYDFQFEKAYAAYINEYRIQKIQTYLNIYKPQTISSSIAVDFSIYKLNGTTGFIDTNDDNKKEGYFFSNLASPWEDDYTKYVLQYAQCIEDSDSYFPMLSFAWERPKPESHQFFTSLKYSVEKTDALVIIGYSFPYFNRAIDKLILENFKDASIYVQDTEPQNVINTLSSFLPERSRESFHPLTVNSATKSQFHIPFELDNK